MTSLKQLIVVASFATLPFTGLDAQTVELRANIPFDFHVGNKLLPAGEYVIQEQGSMVSVRSADGQGPGSTLFTYETTAGGRPGPARLDFDDYGSEYFLSEIWNPYNPEARAVPKTARQRELAGRFHVPVKATVLLASSK